jgi:hypothetical protein
MTRDAGCEFKLFHNTSKAMPSKNGLYGVFFEPGPASDATLG